MEDESHGNIAQDPNRGSLETSYLRGNNNNNSDNNKELNRFLPIANVGRIMKKIIPGNGKISKDAKETVQECVSEFISFVTGEASDKCQREKRKTINGDDVIWAITTLEFEDYVAPLKLYLSKYRDIEGEKLNIPKQQRSDPRIQQQQQQQHEQDQFNSIYSSTMTSHHHLISHHHHQPSFIPTDRHQAFTLPFSPNTIHEQLQQTQDQIDSVGHWSEFNPEILAKVGK